MNAMVSPGPIHLLDLPTELLLEVLRDAPWSLRATCSRFRELLDGTRLALSLRPCPGAQRQLQHLTLLLRRLPSLASLHVGTSEFKALPFLAACPSLESLTFADAPHLTTSALNSLRTCQHLTSLDLSGCHAQQLTSLTALTALTALRSLDVGSCIELTSIAPLAHCAHITSLTLGDGVTSLGPLTALHSLASLVCGDYPKQGVSYYSPLTSAASSLTRLHFTHARAAALRALSACTRLMSLELERAWDVHSLSTLTECGRSLTRLHLCSSPIVDLRPISACHALSDLALYNCWAVQSISPLASLGPTLTSLHLKYTPITDCSPFSALTALCHLDLRSTSCTSAVPMAACTNLRTLRVAYCHIPAYQLHALKQALPLLVVDETTTTT